MNTIRQWTVGLCVFVLVSGLGLVSYFRLATYCKGERALRD